jgi:serine/threonine protein phosphatase PrpC
MGTTVVGGQIVGDKFYIAHVGDSRCYRIRGAEIQQMTRDHSLLEDYKDAKPDMSDEEQRKFPHKNVITRALGMRDTVQVDVHVQDIAEGDIFLLCSDGLSGMVDDAFILKTVTATPSLEQAVAELVDAANHAGGTDNITVLALQCLPPN